MAAKAPVVTVRPRATSACACMKVDEVGLCWAARILVHDTKQCRSISQVCRLWAVAPVRSIHFDRMDESCVRLLIACRRRASHELG